MKEETLKEMIVNHISSAYPNLRRLAYAEAIHSTWRRADVLFVEGRRDRVHVIEAEPTLERCFNPKHGFAQVRRLKANYRWLALPLSEFNRNPAAFGAARRDTGAGAMAAYGRPGRGGIRELLQPTFIPGNFLHLYIEADDVWNA